MSKKNQNGKVNFKILIIVICVLVVGVTFYMIHDIKKKIKENNLNNVEETIENYETETVENVLNETENTIINNISNELESETSITETTANNSTGNASTQMQAGVTDKKQRAIELVKEKWGEDDTVNFVFDYVNENGEYVIAVKDKTSATVKYYFRVNLDTETVELD